MKRLLTGLITLCLLAGLVSCETDKKKERGYLFTVGTLTTFVDAEAEPLLAMLGEPQNFSESPSCGFEGLDKTYQYSDLRVTTYPYNGKDYVNSVTLMTDAYATPEGITVGSTEEEVKAAYGEPSQRTDSAMVYSAANMKLQITVAGGVVKVIRYLKTDSGNP